MNIRILVAALMLAWLAPAPARAVTPLLLQSARIDYSGVELTLVFSGGTPASYSHPFLTPTTLTLTDGVNNTQTPVPKGGNFNVEGGQLIWTLRYHLNSRITTTMGNFTVSWSGSLADDGEGNSTGSGASVPVVKDTRVDSQGWSVFSVRPDAGVASLAPNQISGLYAWYDTSARQLYKNVTGTDEATIDGDAIAFWKDRTLNGRNFIQSDPDHRPVLRLSVLNGKRVVQFTGLDDEDTTKGLLCATFGLQANQSPISVFVVARTTPATKTVADTIVGQGAAANQQHIVITASPLQLKFGTANATGGKENAIQKSDVFGLRGEWLAAGGAWTFDQDNNAFGWNLGAGTFQNPSIPNDASGAWAIGSWPNLTNGLYGEIAEIVIFNVALSDQNAKALSSYFMDKYAIRPRQIHVSESGADSNNGLSGASPKQTPTAGAALVRPGLGDQLLFLRGSTFSQGFPVRSGWSLQYPSLYSTYDPPTPVELARPIFKIPDGNGIKGVNFETSSAVQVAQSIAIAGLDLYCSQRDPVSADYEFPTFNNSKGVSIEARELYNILIEDCVVRFFRDNIVAQTTLAGQRISDNIFIRRNIVHESYDTTADTDGKLSRSAGIFALFSQANRVLVEENVFHHNAWMSDHAPMVAFAGGTYSHSLLKITVTGTPFAVYGGVANDLRFRCDAGTDVNSYGGRPIAQITSNTITLEAPGLGGAADGKTDIAGAVGKLVDAIPNIYSHNMYLNGDSTESGEVGDGPRGYIVRGNFSTYGASHGVQQRPGGVCEHNVFYGNAIHAFTGRNDHPDSVRNPSLIWRCLFLPARSPIYVDTDEEGPNAPFPQGRNWGFDSNGGHDTFINECIFTMPESIAAPGAPFHAGRALALITRNHNSEECRVYCRNNTVRLGDPNAVQRQHDTDSTPNAFEDGSFEWNLLSQPSSGPGKRIIDWQREDTTQEMTVWSFHDNYYWSWGSNGAKEWFRKGITSQSYAEWIDYTNDGTSVQAGTEPTFVDAGRTLGQYYNSVLSEVGKTSEQFITEKLLTRGRLNWDPDLSAYSVIDWFRAGFTPTNLPPGTKYGAVPY